MKCCNCHRPLAKPFRQFKSASHIQGSLRTVTRETAWCEPCWTAHEEQCRRSTEEMLARTQREIAAALAAAGE
jgi:hypothetical protein